MTMMRLAAVTVGLVLLSGAAFAQDFTAEQRAACRGDYNKFLPGHASGRRPGAGLPEQAAREAVSGMQKGGRRAEEVTSPLTRA